MDKVYIDTLYNWQDKLINSRTISLLALEIMKLVEVQNIKGREKKDIVIKVLQLVILHSNLTTKEKEKLNFIVENVIPTIIDTYISLDKNKLKISINNKCGSCYSW